jgi:NADPH2:quinone reductase
MIVSMHAIEVAELGGPEVLRYVDKPQPSPASGEVLIKAEAIGINFIDTYFRSGQYPRELPFVLGTEVSGTVAAVGDGVTSLRAGDRVVTAAASGAYAEFSTAPAQFVAQLPAEVDFDVAASALLKGLTAHYLIKSVYPAQPGDTVLLHAGAGGVGLILTQWAAALGVRVITTVSTQQKAELSREAGASEVLDYPDDADEFGTNPGVDRRRRCGRGLRRSGGQHVRRQPGQPGRSGHVGIVRRRQRTSGPGRPPAPQRRGVGVSDTPEAG